MYSKDEHFCFIGTFFHLVSSVNLKGAAWRYEKAQPKLTGLKWQNYPAAKSGMQWRHMQSGWGEAGSILSGCSVSVVPQLEEANDLLRAESDTAARLRKNHTEMAKSMSQLESLNRELQERSRAIDGEKAQLEKEVLLIQSTLDSERRNYSQGSEEIRELQGE